MATARTLKNDRNKCHARAVNLRVSALAAQDRGDRAEARRLRELARLSDDEAAMLGRRIATLETTA